MQPRPHCNAQPNRSLRSAPVPPAPPCTALRIEKRVGRAVWCKKHHIARRRQPTARTNTQWHPRLPRTTRTALCMQPRPHCNARPNRSLRSAPVSPAPPCTALRIEKRVGRAVWCKKTPHRSSEAANRAHQHTETPALATHHAHRPHATLSAQSLTKMAKLALALALAPAVTAFAPVAAPKASTQLQASIQDTLATMEGPEIFWGSDGVLLGHDEADIKGYDNFDQLAAALSKEGVDLSGGEYTVLAPSNSAFDKHNAEVGTPVTADVLKYHVIEGKKSMDALNSDQKTT